MKSRGFTLVEIMIVVAIIGIGAAIAIPNFAASRASAMTTVCNANRKQLEESLMLAVAMEGADIEWLNAGEIEGLLLPNYLKTMPECPYGGNYKSTEVTYLLFIECSVCENTDP